jgi:hypothetical protein
MALAGHRLAEAAEGDGLGKRALELLALFAFARRSRGSKAVSVGPGHTTFTLICLRASSRAMVLEKATRPPLQKAYTASPDEPPRAASEATFTTLPYRARPCP